VADGVLASNTYQALRAGAATDMLQIMEVYEGGQAGASSVNAMCLARASTLETTPTALALPNSDSSMNANASTLTNLPTAFVAAGTGPTRASAVTVARMGLTFNAFGGIVRWVAAPGEEWMSIGTAAAGTTLLSATAPGTPGLMGSHFIYELL
jgi:hypothetical protein